MKISLAQTISFILNPLVVIVFVPFFFVYKSTHNFTSAVHWTLYTLIFLFGIALFVIFEVKKGTFTDLDVSHREQRPLLFLVGIIISSIYFVSLFFLDAPPVLFAIAFGIMLGIAVVSIINKRVKASIHVAAVTALILAVAVGFGGYYLFLLFLIPLVVWARLTTKRHSLTEAITGGILGGLLSLSVYYGYLAVKIFFHK